MSLTLRHDAAAAPRTAPACCTGSWAEARRAQGWGPISTDGASSITSRTG